MMNKYTHTKQQTSILKTNDTGHLTPISTKTRKRSSKKRNHSQDSVIQELLNIRTNKSSTKQQSKKKSRSKSNKNASKKKQISKVPLEITVLRANGSNSRLNVTAYVPSSRNHYKKDRKQSLSASHTSKNKRIHIKRSISDESDSRSPDSIRIEKKENSHSGKFIFKIFSPIVRKSEFGKKKHSLTRDDKQISQEFQIDSQKNQASELQQTREQLAHYRQLVYELKKQLEVVGTMQKKIQDEHSRSDHFLSRSQKYKTMARAYKGELASIQSALESEKAQKIIAIEREQSRIRIGETIRKQQRLIINEMVLALQRIQVTIRDMDENGDLQKQLHEIFCLVNTFHNISNIQTKNASQDQTFSEITNEQHQALLSGFNSDQLGFTHNSEGTYLNTERVEIHPCSQTQMLSYSIFSPKFMVSSERANGNHMTQTFSQTTQQHATTQGPCNDSSAIENFTLTYDQNNQHNNTQTTNQSGDNQQINLLLKVQQEIIHMREQQAHLIEENRRLKEVNEKVARRQEKIDISMKDKIQLMLQENAKIREERDTALKQMQELARIQTVIVKRSDQNSTNRSHDDTLDLQQYVQSKKGSSVHQKYNSSGAASSDQDDVSLATYNQPYIITQENQHQLTLMNQRPSQSSIDSLSQSLYRSRFQKAGLPLRSNSRSSVNQDPTLQKTFDNERDQLFSLSSTQPGDITPVDKRDKENIAPRHLDFNQNQMIPRHAAVFQLVHPEIINHNESCQTQKPAKSEIIKVEDTIGQYSHEVTTNRANNSYIKSTEHISMIKKEQQNQLNTSDPTHNTRTYTQESEKPPLSDMRSSMSGGEYRNNNHNNLNFSRTHYQQLNYTESDQSFDRNRYSNYDSKNVTQQLPAIIQVKEGKPFDEDQLFSKATTSKNTSRKALLGVQVLNKDSSNEQLMPMRQIMERQPNSSLFVSKREENLNHNGSALQDFKNQMFNNTGILSHQVSNQGPISTQGDIQEKQMTMTSNQSACVRTLNLKKEISTLDREIQLLQQSLKQALHTKKPLVE